MYLLKNEDGAPTAQCGFLFFLLLLTILVICSPKQRLSRISLHCIPRHILQNESHPVILRLVCHWFGRENISSIVNYVFKHFEAYIALIFTTPFRAHRNKIIHEGLYCAMSGHF